jgi:hypothetical protein
METDIVARVVLAYLEKKNNPTEDHEEDYEDLSKEAKSRIKGPKPFKIKKRRSPAERLKARLYYRKNKAKINLARRRTYRKSKVYTKSRKLHKRQQPGSGTTNVKKPLRTTGKIGPQTITRIKKRPARVNLFGGKKKYKLNVPKKVNK